MNAYILCYDTFALFETVLVSYMFNSTQNTLMVGLDDRPVKSFENITVVPDLHIEKVQITSEDLFVVPGGNYTTIPQNQYLSHLFGRLFDGQIKTAAICAGVNLLDSYGCIAGYNTILNTEENLVRDRNLVTAKPNAFVEFAIELANDFGVLGDEQGYKETIAFFKNTSFIPQPPMEEVL